MATVVFTLNGNQTIIQCTVYEKMRDIINKYLLKVKIDVNKTQFLYGGNQINYDLTFFQQANIFDKERHVMNILVYVSTFNQSINQGIIQSKEVICPTCKENCLIELP